ncbi:MAG: single-stranded DNA-binding protein [Phycisphaerae bacterium]
MASYNRIILMGNLTRDPELSYTPSNVAICKFGLATNHKWKDHEEVCFVDCVAFGRSGETINQYMSKGRPILLEGRLKLDRWTSPEGDKRSKHEVVVDKFSFVGSAGGGGGGASRDHVPPQAESSAPAPAGAAYEAPPPAAEDIPF